MPQKNSYNLSFGIKQTANIGLITPLAFQEVIPGDEMNIDYNYDIKFAPLVGPVLGLFKLRTYTFFVPTKLIWEDFETGYSDDPAAPVAVPPYRDYDLNLGFSMNQFWRYFAPRVPTAAAHVNLNMLPLRAYQKIYYDYFYRNSSTDSIDNQNTFLETTSGADVNTENLIYEDYYREDYFSDLLQDQFYSTFTTFGGAAFTAEQLATWLANARQQSILKKLRNNFHEYIQEIYGVNYSDSSRCKLIQAGEKYFTFTDIVNTSLTATAPLGVPSSMIHVQSYGDKKTFTSKEHGYLMYLIVVEPMADTFGCRDEIIAYDKYSIHNPNYEALGNIPVMKRNVWNDFTTVNQTDVVGYKPIYDKLRKTRGFVGGEFVDATPSVLVLRKPSQPTTAQLIQITASDYNYIFSTFVIPQIRIFGYVNNFAKRVLKKPISIIPDLTKIIE